MKTNPAFAASKSIVRVEKTAPLRRGGGELSESNGAVGKMEMNGTPGRC